ncbi:sulfite exporter TauE/SafE family protein [Rhizobium sp. LC145]|uniref:sulfite exporter TauE/SafE family protein n=1 Tax=Rhizobium sp. LC145 TaxID=1120688 RepID=UPI00062A500C|nr:sulfite exporter TauE/SafE family protein [Rhizobium sp. LC145]KKX29436.1 membrane protein [Rhizobium sp. LC145]MDX3927978.1 sulfite exporter TauE/SafE family protein [Shinella sp.]TKT66186.1 sulfite exporter TauE/SafE family protein [Rhizobiaceae bacterium LC148]
MFVNDEAGWLAVLFLVIALLYASVGQAGASGYLAAMGLFGMAAAPMKVTALALNLLVAAIGTLQFWRMGLLSWRAFYPFAILGVPFSLLGGAVQFPTALYYPLVGVILVLSAIQMIRSAKRSSSVQDIHHTEPPFFPALAVGAAIGFISGSTGTGGGIFLAPIIISMRWVNLRRTAAVTAVYNFLNSAAALIGAHATLDTMPAPLPLWMVSVAIGGVVGALLGSRYLPDAALRYLLAGVLFVSGAKLLLA